MEGAKGGAAKAISLTFIYDTIEDADGDFIRIQVNERQAMHVNANELREAIADVLPKGDV
jgi:hypothetical protein